MLWLLLKTLKVVTNHPLWTETTPSSGEVCVYILMFVGFNLMYEYLYWLVGTINRDGADLIRLSAVIRGVESAGQAISYGINSIDSFKLSGAVGVNMSFFAACIIPSAFVVFKTGIINGEKAHPIVHDEVSGVSPNDTKGDPEQPTETRLQFDNDAKSRM